VAIQGHTKPAATAETIFTSNAEIQSARNEAGSTKKAVLF
jgi:hypothetical protein